ncbi:hypothetical protein [Sphingomonas sp.]
MVKRMPIANRDDMACRVMRVTVALFAKLGIRSMEGVEPMRLEKTCC